MAEDKTGKETGEPEGDDDDGKREEAFWKKLDERIDAGVGRAIEKYRPKASQRNGRSTLPGIMADFMFGKETQAK